MTNCERIKGMTAEEMADLFDKIDNQDRQDWEPIGCFHCTNRGTHHADKALIGTEHEHLYNCGGCEFEYGIINWINAEHKEDGKDA